MGDEELTQGTGLDAIDEDEVLSQNEEEFRRFLSEELEGELDADRIVQIADALRNILYWKAKQYVVPKFNKLDGTFDCECVDAPEDKEMFRSVYNIFKADGQVFIGAVAPRAANVKIVPEDPEDDQQDFKARMADALIQHYWKKWNANSLQKSFAYHAWTTGPYFIYQYWNADGHKYGYREEPVIDIREEMMPDGTTVPIAYESGVKQYPKGDVEVLVVNNLYVTVPFKARDRSECGWLKFERKLHKALLKDLYGDKLDMERDDHHGHSYNSEAATDAQATAYSPYGADSEVWKRSEWMHTLLWVRPMMYNLLRGKVTSAETGEIAELKEYLKERYPDGIKIAYVNGKPIEIVGERLDDHWTIGKTGSGEFLSDPPWGNDVIPMQDDLNNLINYAKEIVLRSVVKTLISSDLIDRDTAREADNMVHELIFTKAFGGDIRHMMAEMPQGKMPEKLVEMIGLLRDISRQVDGANEALAGGGTPAETYRAEKQRRDQSTSRFVPFVEETKKAFESMATNGIKIKIRYGVGQEKIPTKNGLETIDLDVLDEHGWKVDVEEGIPMSFTEESDRLLSHLENPALADTMGLFRPENIDTTNRMIGVSGIIPPGEAERRKFAEILKELVKMEPIRTVDPNTGFETTLPAIEPDETDDFALMAEIARQWLNSPVGMKLKKQNPSGFESVLAYYRACKQLAMQAQAQQAMMPGAPGAPPPASGEPGAESAPPGETPGGEKEGAQAFDVSPPQF